jgi:hypothetical protein
VQLRHVGGLPHAPTLVVALEPPQEALEGLTMTTTAPAQVTKKVERKAGGMPNWAFLSVGKNHEGKWTAYWPYTSKIGGQPFLTRFMVFRTPYLGLDITRVHMADDQREYPHDHSRTFFSWKWGWYAEEVYTDPGDLKAVQHKRHRRLGIHRLGHDEANSITHVSPRLVTVLLTLRQRHASNYWTPDGMQSIGMGVDQGEDWV